MRNVFYLVMVALMFLTSSVTTSSCTRGKGKEAETVVSAQKILKMIRQGKDVNIHGKTIVGKLDFTKSLSFNKKLAVATVYIPVEVCFRNCVFQDSVLTYSSGGTDVMTVFERNVNFESCEFREALVMRQTDFRGRFDFNVSKVKGESDFSGSHFRNGVGFCQANFDGDAMFVSCNFDGRANFFKVFFRNSSFWQYVRFGDITMFSDAHFYGSMDMSKMFAASTVDFANSKFYGGFLLTNSQFLGDLRLIACQFKGQTSIMKNQFMGVFNIRKAQLLDNTTLLDNVFYMDPDCQDHIKADSAELIQQNNKAANLIVKQII